MNDQPTCGRCNKVMTPENSKIHPEYFLCDECAKIAGLVPVQTEWTPTGPGDRTHFVVAPPREEPVGPHRTHPAVELKIVYDAFARIHAKLVQAGCTPPASISFTQGVEQMVDQLIKDDWPNTLMLLRQATEDLSATQVKLDAANADCREAHEKIRVLTEYHESYVQERVVMRALGTEKLSEFILDVTERLDEQNAQQATYMRGMCSGLHMKLREAEESLARVDLMLKQTPAAMKGAMAEGFYLCSGAGEKWKEVAPGTPGFDQAWQALAAKAVKGRDPPAPREPMTYDVLRNKLVENISIEKFVLTYDEFVGLLTDIHLRHLGTLFGDTPIVGPWIMPMQIHGRLIVRPKDGKPWPWFGPEHAIPSEAEIDEWILKKPG